MTHDKRPEPAGIATHGLATPEGIGKVTVIRTPTRSTTCIVTCVQDQSKCLGREGISSAGAISFVPQIQLDPEIRPICKTGPSCSCLRGGVRLWYGASVRPQDAASLLFGDGVLVKVPAPARWRTVSSLTACFGMAVAHKQTEIGPRGSGCICKKKCWRRVEARACQELSCMRLPPATSSQNQNGTAITSQEPT